MCRTFARASQELRAYTTVDGLYKDWRAVIKDLIGADVEKQRVAFLELQRLLTTILAGIAGWNESEKEFRRDLRQTILLKLVGSLRAGQLREPKAFVEYVRVTARNTFYDALRSRRGGNGEEFVQDLEAEMAETPRDPDLALAVQSAIAQLPEKERSAVEMIYLRGFTYAEAAATTTVPLGSFKRYLRQGLNLLRTRLEE